MRVSKQFRGFPKSREGGGGKINPREGKCPPLCSPDIY